MYLQKLNELFEKYGGNDEYYRMNVEKDALDFIQKHETRPDNSDHIRYLCEAILAISDKYLAARAEMIKRVLQGE